MKKLRLLWGTSLAIALAIAASSVAHAEPQVCLLLGGTDYDCRRDGCESAASCSLDLYGPVPICAALVSGDTAVCRPTCSTIFGCAGAADCPRVADSSGNCVAFGPSGGGDPAGICVYPSPSVAIDYCPGSSGDPTVIAHYFYACHTTPTGELTQNYFLGDCDGDGCPNGSDPVPCVAGEEPCGTVMRGLACAPEPLPDAGVIPTPDASVELDGGNQEEDAGNGEEDAGVEPQDDGGPIPMDAGIAFDGGTPPPDVSFHGGGGCTCATAGRPRGAPIALALGLAILGVAVLFRRRR